MSSNLDPGLNVAEYIRNVLTIKTSVKMLHTASHMAGFPTDGHIYDMIMYKQLQTSLMWNETETVVQQPLLYLSLSVFTLYHIRHS